MSQTTIDRTESQPQWTEVRRHGLLWRLDLERYLDREIHEHGCFESRTTDIVRQWIKPGMKILDIGANIGYFATVFSDLVGPTGHVWAFEPTRKYGQRIQWHLDANRLADRATVLNYGLSDCNEERTIDIVDCSASLHLWQGGEVVEHESISLRRLDDVAAELDLPVADFIKIDIDGHEPFFVKGAEGYLRKHRPAMLMEFAWQHLETAGTDIWGLKSQLEALGYELYSETTLQRISSDEQFAAEIGDRSQSSANVWAFAAGRGPKFLPTLAAKRVCDAIGELNRSLGRPAEVWLFGAGQHTAKAIVAKSSWSDLGRVSAIIDDDARFATTGQHLGLPVFNRRDAEAKLKGGAEVDAIILSTDTHQTRFLELTAGFSKQGMKVVSLYPLTPAVC